MSFKEEQKASRKLIESNIMNDKVLKTIQKTDQMFEEVIKEIAAAKGKKGFFRGLFGK